MEEKSMEIIKQLMEELQEQMAYSEDDLGERLGRKKPEVEVMKIEAEGEPMMEGEMDEEMPMDGMEESPEDKFKKRLMSLRG